MPTVPQVWLGCSMCSIKLLLASLLPRSLCDEETEENQVPYQSHCLKGRNTPAVTVAIVTGNKHFSCALSVQFCPINKIKLKLIMPSWERNRSCLDIADCNA